MLLLKFHKGTAAKFPASRTMGLSWVLQSDESRLVTTVCVAEAISVFARPPPETWPI